MIKSSPVSTPLACRPADRRRGWLACLGLLALALPGQVDASPGRADFVRRARVIDHDEIGVSHPTGLAWSRRADALLVLPRAGSGHSGGMAPAEVGLVDRDRPARRRGLGVTFDDPLNVTFDNKAHRLIAYDARSRQLISVPAAADGKPIPGRRIRVPAHHLGIGDAQGLSVDPATGRVFVLDAAGPQLVVLTPAADGDLRGATREALALQVPGPCRGLAFDPSTRHLHVLNPARQRLYEVADDGTVVANRDVSGLGLVHPQALAFAPSGDSTDDALQTSLYVADAGPEPFPASPATDADSDSATPTSAGQIVELSMTAPAEPAAATTATATLVQQVDTWRYNPESPDSMGIAYIDTSDSLLMSDSEVNEISSRFTGVNVFEIDYTDGSLIGTASTLEPIDFSTEPVGVAFDPATERLFISHDDGGGKFFVILPDNNGNYLTSNSSVTEVPTGGFGNGDPEGISFDRSQGFLYIADGVDSEVYEIDPGSDGDFGTNDDRTSHFDTASLGCTDPEGITWDTLSGNLYIVGNPTDTVFEVTTSGTLVRVIDNTDADPPNPSGLAYGPASNNPAARNLYITDRGVDNNSDPDENDGQLFEVSFGSTSPGNQPPQVNAGPDLDVTLPDTATLDATVTDDPQQTLGFEWIEVSGPGSVSFGDANAEDTTASFSAPGTYVLRLTANDGELSGSDETTVTVTGTSGNGVIEIRVGAGSDDAEERLANNQVRLTSSDLELIDDKGQLQVVGMRFDGVGVPQGASIVDAWVQFKADEDGSVPTDLTIRGQYAGNAGTFTTLSRNVSSRTPTSAFATWSPGPWTRGQAGPAQRTPQLNGVIAEIVSHPSWSSGNALALLVSGSGVRIAESFDGDAPGAPLLHIEYTTEANDPPAVSISLPSNGASFDEGQPISFAGSAIDNEDGVLTGNLAWSSSLDGSIGSGGSFSRADLSVGSHTITATVTDSGGRSGSAQRSISVNAVNTAPSVSISAPASGSSFSQGQLINFNGTAGDAEDGNLSSSLSWSSSIDGGFGSGASVSTSGLSVGTHSISASVTDSGGLSGSDSISISVSVTSNSPPVVSISAPPDGTSVTEGEALILMGSASDAEDGNITASLAWSSDRDGGLGNGGSVDASGLSVGAHTITAAVTDSGGLSDSAQIGVSVTPDGGVPIEVQVRVGSGADDAEEEAGPVDLNSSDLELVFDKVDQVVGLRFNGVAIPQGASILSASVQFEADETHSGVTTLTLRGQAHDDAPPFSAANNDLSSRATTTAATGWTPPAWNARGDAGPAQETPDLAAVIQEIVNRPGWSLGNSLALLISGSGKRVAESYEGSAAGAALLKVTYSGSPNDAPVVDISAPSNGASFTQGDSVSFSGTATDTEDGTLTGSLSWTSSLDGTIGSGASFSTSSLSLGTHTITASVTDSGGRSGSDQITITVASSGGSITLELPVAASSDDAEEVAGNVNLRSSDLELVFSGGDQTVGVRFAGATIPAGATIQQAWIQFQVDEVDTTATALTIRGQQTANAATFTGAGNDITSRPTTSASQTWNPPAWDVAGARGAAQRTPDLSAVIQEIISQPGWTSGNALAVIITGTGVRTAESFDGDAAGAPLLHVEYTP